MENLASDINFSMEPSITIFFWKCALGHTNVSSTNHKLRLYLNLHTNLEILIQSTND